MEKQLSKINKYISLISVIFIVSFSLFSQSSSVVNHIRFVVWANVSACPDLEYSREYEGLEYSVKSIKETAPFLVNGMVYGWDFSYTPYDKTRGVDEYLEVTEIVPSDYIKGQIKYSSPWIEDEKLKCWCDFYRNESQVQEYYKWSSIHNPVITGKGYGKLEDGFDGIKAAANDALKNAIRHYYRNIIKNKPKEIRGRVLIKDLPLLGIDSGRYVFNLDFFLECGKIIEYRVF